jgi:hypothetical protein
MSVRILMVLFSAVLMPLYPANAYQATPAAKIECVRPVPQPIVKKAVFPNTRFTLSKADESGQNIPSGTETVKFNNGDRLTITNSGCEYVNLRFRFETSRFDRQQISNSQYLYRRSAWLMRQTLRGLETPLDLAKGTIALEKYAAQSPQPDLDQIIKYGGTEIQSVVKLVQVKPLSKRKTVVEVLFYYGPI